MQCPASRGMEELYPPYEGSPHAAEGELAHRVALAAVKQIAPPDGATEEMLGGAELYRDVLHGFISTGNKWHLEERVPGLHPENWGTPDAWRYSETNKSLNIVDYKFGHRYVDVFENWQLLNYAGGIVKTLDIHDDVTLHLTIVQPRSYCAEGQVRNWSLSVEEARNLYFDSIAFNCELSLRVDAQYANGKECRDCSGRRACGHLQQEVGNYIDVSREQTPYDLKDDQMGRELRWVKDAVALMSARMDGLEQEMIHRISSGNAISGWTIERGEGRSEWNKSVEEIITLGQMMGVDVYKPSVITPTQAIKKGLDKDVVSQYSERRAGAATLVPFKAVKLFKE